MRFQQALAQRSHQAAARITSVGTALVVGRAPTPLARTEELATRGTAQTAFSRKIAEADPSRTGSRGTLQIEVVTSWKGDLHAREVLIWPCQHARGGRPSAVLGSIFSFRSSAKITVVVDSCSLTDRLAAPTSPYF